MMKRRLVWILTSLAAVIIIALLLILPDSGDITVVKSRAQELPEGQAILCNAYPEAKSVQKGDAFLFILEVLYDTNQVSGIDSVSLNDNVNLSPFEIRETTDVVFNLDSDTMVFQRQFEIQLISGDVDKLYSFPTIVVRYELPGADGYAETSVIPETIYVSPRLPDNVMVAGTTQLNYESLRSLEGKIESSGTSRIALIMWILGGLLGVAAVTDLTLRYVYRGKETSAKSGEVDMSDTLQQAYRSLHEKVKAGAEAGNIFHQIDHILRLVMIQKENNSWLQEIELEQVSVEIRPTVISLFAKCSEPGMQEAGQQEIDAALKQLDDILEFYFAEEIGEWKG
jgi:hypothetical protein